MSNYEKYLEYEKLHQDKYDAIDEALDIEYQIWKERNQNDNDE